MEDSLWAIREKFSTMTKPKLITILTLLGAGSFSALALADKQVSASRSAVVRLSECDSIELDALERSLDLERLGEQASMDVFVHCVPDSTVASIRLFLPRLQREKHGTIDFRGIDPTGWTRTLALTISELERDSTYLPHTNAAALGEATSPLPANSHVSVRSPFAATPQRISHRSEPAIPSTMPNLDTGHRRWWLGIGSSTMTQSLAVATSATPLLLTNYDFAVWELGGGYRPVSWLALGVDYASNINRYSDLDHEMGADLLGIIPGPTYERSSLNAELSSPSWGRWSVHGLAALSEESSSVSSRSMRTSTSNSIYPISPLDPVGVSQSVFSGGLRLELGLRSWLDLSATYQQLHVLAMDLGPHRGNLSGGQGQSAAVSIDMGLGDGFSLHGRFAMQGQHANNANVSFGATSREAALRLRLEL